jgi:hypothetical protein
MFEQVPIVPPYNEDPTGQPQVHHTRFICIVHSLMLFSDSRLYGDVEVIRRDYRYCA